MQLPDTPPKNDVATKALPSEKPLPTPPLAQVITGSPIKEARCLVDATEKPLRRSPPGKPHKEEEWPVLFPEKPTTPGTLREMHSQDSHKPMLRLTSHAKERYSALANLKNSSTTIKVSPTKKSCSVQSIQRKPVSTEEPFENPSVSPQNPHVKASSTARDGPKASAAEFTTLMPPSDLSASASALEKYAQESKKFPEPRPTRTSSLRARISSGNLTTSAKVVGFTDFTTIKEDSGITEQGTLWIPSDSRSHSKSPSMSTAPGKKPSLGPVRPNRAPAKFVAGSRRQTIPHRPSSRGSIRVDANDRTTADGTCPPSRNAPDVPASKICEPELGKGPKEQSELVAPERRRSSIPIFRGAARNVVDHGEGEADMIKLAPTVSADSKHHPRKGSNFFEDRKSATPGATLASVVSDASLKRKQGQKPLSWGKKAEESPMLEAVSESPRSSYQIKRLSMTSPEHGPTLRISPSAERLIMGKDTEKENQQNLKKKQSKDLRRTVVTNELRKTVMDAEVNSGSRKHDGRPHTSASHIQTRSRVYIMDDEVEPKKEESTATKHALPTNHLDPEFPGHRNTESSNNEDPFFDAQSHLSRRGSATVETCPAGAVVNVGDDASVKTSKDVQHMISMDEASWISPMPKKVSSISLSDAMPVTPAFLPASMLEHVRNSVLTESLADLTHTIERAQSSLEAKLDDAIVPKELLSTPEHFDQDRPSTSHGDFPPRSSSRVPAPDYTTNVLTNTSSPVSPTEAGKSLSIDFSTRQNKLGEEFGWGSEQLDFSNPNAKRDSLARESNKSQGSYSKGVLSNFRDIFHKRSGDTPELRSSIKATKKGKGKVSITSHGSPFPPMSEVHPIHRPTLASTSKSRAAVAIDKKTPLLSYESPGRNNTISNATPAFQSPIPSEICTTTSLAMQVIDSARLETSTPKREKLLELGKIMVDTLAQAREAEKAMEEAKQAARRAEVSYVLCKKSVSDLAKFVENWDKHSRVGRL